MIAKLTSKNQITIPKAILKGLQADYFNVEQENGRIILIPVITNTADIIREKIAGLGITEKDISDAVSWARK